MSTDPLVDVVSRNHSLRTMGLVAQPGPSLSFVLIFMFSFRVLRVECGGVCVCVYVCVCVCVCNVYGVQAAVPTLCGLYTMK